MPVIHPLNHRHYHYDNLFLFSLTAKIEINSIINDTIAIEINAMFKPWIGVDLSPTIVMIPTNTAEPIALAIVRNDVSRAVPCAVFPLILLIPHVTRGIIRHPMDIHLTTFSSAATARGVFMLIKNIPILLIHMTALPTTNSRLIPSLS